MANQDNSKKKIDQEDPKEPEQTSTPEDSIEYEERIDEWGIDMFRSMGYKGRLPDETVTVYNEYKRRKDILQPGRLSPGEFAYVTLLADIMTNRFKVGE